MKRIYFFLGMAVVLGATLGLLGTRSLRAQEPLKTGTVIQRVDVAGSKGMEAILVLRDLPPGGESGKHTQSGTEIVYILDGSAVVEIEGKPARTLKAGEAFT